MTTFNPAGGIKTHDFRPITIVFEVDRKTYKTQLNLDIANQDTIDITELQGDIRKGVKSGGKERKIYVL